MKSLYPNVVFVGSRLLCDVHGVASIFVLITSMKNIIIVAIINRNFQYIYRFLLVYFFQRIITQYSMYKKRLQMLKYCFIQPLRS